jgi:hypothetical protein
MATSAINRFGSRDAVVPSAKAGDDTHFQKDDCDGVTARHPLTVLLYLASTSEGQGNNGR